MYLVHQSDTPLGWFEFAAWNGGLREQLSSAVTVRQLLFFEKFHLTKINMALPPIFTDFVQKNGNTLQNIALLNYLKHGEVAKPLLQKTTAALVTHLRHILI